MQHEHDDAGPQHLRLPRPVLDYAVLRPMRWATAGTITAAREAMTHGLAINLAGGYHHARPHHDYGFSAYADVALAIGSLRRTGALGESDRVVYVDLDAHQGDGVCRCFQADRRVLIYDQYDARICPGDAEARWRIDCDVPLPHGCPEADYLHALQENLPRSSTPLPAAPCASPSTAPAPTSTPTTSSAA